MNSQIEEVKNRTDIVSLISEYIDLKKAGRNYKANCPFHGEKTPSFMVSPELQIYKCFGCGESGDVFSFLQKYENMEFSEALKYLADKAGVTLTSYKPSDTSLKEKIIEINKSAQGFYNYVLYKHPSSKKVIEYLKNDRGLTDETIKTFGIGYSLDKPGFLYDYLLIKKAFKKDELDKSGLFAGRSFDRFGGRVIFPLIDHRGNIVGFSGRILPWERQDRAKYINSPETTAYHKSQLLYGLDITKRHIKDMGYVVIVEGELDMISAYQAGIKNIVAIKGSALTEDQIRLINRFCNKIVLSLDSDFAGDAASRKGAVLAQNLGCDVRVARLKGFKDPDEAVKKNIGFYKKTLDEAVGIWDFLIDIIFEKYNLTGSGKAKISREVIPVLEMISDKIVKSHYVGYVAQRLSVPFDSVNAMLGKSRSDLEKENDPFLLQKEEKSRKQLLEERLLGLYLNFLPENLKRENIKKKFSTSLVLRIIDFYIKYEKKNVFELKKFFESLPGELKEGFSSIVLSDLSRDEIPLVEKEIQILGFRKKMETASVRIQEAESIKDKVKLKKYQEEFAKTAEKLSLLEEEN